MFTSNQLRKTFIALSLLMLAACTSGPNQSRTEKYVEDSVITTKVKSAFFNEPSLKSAEINVETFKGTVQLSGFINSREDMSTAVELTRQISGVESVKNDMRLK